ncbi:N-acetylgalactosamine kinase [Chamberlinius hualienensis]
MRGIELTPVLPLPNNDNKLLERVARLKAIFESEFHCKPAFVVRAPGRVNLIGEHIDYCGYAVLPMAIEQCILMAVAEDPFPGLTFVNVDSEKFPRFGCNTAGVVIDKTSPRWYNYVLAGFLGVVEDAELGLPKGMKIAVDGDIPNSAGLSSSSALVCAAATATAFINDCQISKMDLANLCARSERFVGTEGGGMDQAICFLAEPGKAKLIEFNPLKTFDVHLPKGYVFVIGNSLSDINKAATSQYNTRVVECRIATKIMAKLLDYDWKELRLLGQLQQKANLTPGEMAVKVSQLLHSQPYTRKEVCAILELDDEEFSKSCLNQNTHHLEEFFLQKRALHVYTESQRVRDFKNVCDSGAKNAAEKLGNLMNESHSSCKDLYECSHPNLDEFVDLAKKSGALGSRLTGAGWGGCTVSLVPESSVQTFLTNVTNGFYAIEQARLDRLATSLFPTLPGSGCAIYTF